MFLTASFGNALSFLLDAYAEVSVFSSIVAFALFETSVESLSEVTNGL